METPATPAMKTDDDAVEEAPATPTPLPEIPTGHQRVLMQYVVLFLIRKTASEMAAAYLRIWAERMIKTLEGIVSVKPSVSRTFLQNVGSVVACLLLDRYDIPISKFTMWCVLILSGVKGVLNVKTDAGDVKEAVNEMRKELRSYVEEMRKELKSSDNETRKELKSVQSLAEVAVEEIRNVKKWGEEKGHCKL